MPLMLNCLVSNAQEFKINEAGCFNNYGVDVACFDDYYPEGHQGGVCIIMNGKRLATNGDLRLEPTPGQWQPVPKKVDRRVSDNVISARMCFPDTSRHLKGFNPAVYPDLAFYYTVETKAAGKAVEHAACKAVSGSGCVHNLYVLTADRS